MAHYFRGSVIACAALLAACGGGGGGDGGGNLQVGVGLAQIDSQSAPEIAAAVAGAVTDSQSLATIGGFSLPGVPTGFASASAGAPQILAATFGPEVVECAVAGSLSLSGSLAVPQSLTVGDSLVFEFSDCDDGEGVQADGRLEFEIVAFSGDVAMGMITLTVSMSLEGLAFFEDGSGGSTSGELSFTIDTTNPPETFIAISSAQFTATAAADTVTLTNYILTMTLDPSLGSIVLDSSATVSASQLDGNIEYVTTESLVLDVDGVPTTGEIVVTGAGSATLTIDIVSAELVELHIDADGNDTIDEVIVTSWAELTG